MSNRLSFIRIVICAFLFLFSSCAAPMLSTSVYDRDVMKVAGLIAPEMDHAARPAASFDLFDLSRHIVTLSRQYELDPLLVLAIVKVESQFRPTVRSSAGAVGLMQVMPIVIREVGSEVSVRYQNELLDPYKNLHLGIHYLTYLLERYENNLQKALVAYNMGPTALDSRLSRRSEVSSNYYLKVMHCYKDFQKRLLKFHEII